MALKACTQNLTGKPLNFVRLQCGNCQWVADLGLGGRNDVQRTRPEFKSSATMAFKRGFKVKKDHQHTPDVRKPVKNCEICDKEVLMGVSQNSPLRASERWDGTRYLRFCSPECAKRGGW